MERSFDIVELIENNPITRLTNTYQNKLITKIKNKFTDTEQQLFVGSFYCFLNYNQREDFVIDLDNVWKWIGFSTKQKAKMLLEKHFVNDDDYKFILNHQVKQDTQTHGGHNKETILMNIRTFKLFCLKAGTKKAEQIHEYYIKLEETLQEVIQEESDELKLQLENKENELKCKESELEKKDNEKNRIREKTLIENFPSNQQCVYYGLVDNVSDNNEKLVKFGNSNNLKNRVCNHKDTYSNFRLINAFKVENKLQIENAMKEHPVLSVRQRTITINNKNYVELLNIDDLSFTELDKIIKSIISGIDFTAENYEKLLSENRTLKAKLNENGDALLLKVENDKLKLENIKLIKKYNTLLRKTNTSIGDAEDMCGYDDDDEISETIEKSYEQSISKVKSRFKNITRNKDGKYHIQGKIYEKLTGTREEVFNEIAYRTSGELNKDDLIVNKSGKIVSKKKVIYETNNNRFEEINLKKQKKV